MIKNRLKEIRMREYAMESGEFAKLLGIHYSTYSSWEIGVSRPTLDKAFEIANKLNKTITDIWYFEK